MKLEIHMQYKDEEGDVTDIGEISSYIFPDNLITAEEQEKQLYEFIETTLANTPKTDIVNSSAVSIQVCTDLIFDDDRKTKLGGCSISGATIHATNVTISEMATGQLVRQIILTLKEEE